MHLKCVMGYDTKLRFCLTLVSGLFFQAVFAAPGDLLQTVDLPQAAQCSTSDGSNNAAIGTSVALAPGGIFGANAPIVLITSCASSNTGTLYVVDPSTTPATLVNTINTSVAPPRGWGALAYRADDNDLIACGSDTNGTNVVYSISFNGNANQLFLGASGGFLCDGLAWDAADRTVFQSPAAGGTVHHYRESGINLARFSVPGGCTSSGLAAGGSIGASLYAGCGDGLTVRQLNKITGAQDRSFSSADTASAISLSNQRTGDLECDPVTFSATRRDAIWVKDAFSNRLLAYEIPYRTCGLGGTAPEIPSACPNGSTQDSDGDSLLDCWETDGIDFDNDGSSDLTLPGANPGRKDIYLEIDWMPSHQPSQLALDLVVRSFRDAPVNNPDGSTGISLHVLADEAARIYDNQGLFHNDSLSFRGSTGSPIAGVPDFDEVKSASFGTANQRSNANRINILNAKRLAYHYAVFAHNLQGLGGTSGSAELRGNDFVVSLGNFDNVNGHNVGNVDEQSGTLMHELGHNLNLQHGGGDQVNCKPNYLSVMSYSRQFSGSYGLYDRALDYSRTLLPTLVESSLDETAGLLSDPSQETVYGPRLNGGLGLVLTNGAIDWNRNGYDGDANVGADINNLGGSCDGNGDQLAGYDDWSNLDYNLRGSGSFADGSHETAAAIFEPSREDLAQSSPDSDGDGIVDIKDNCPFKANPRQQDKDHNDVGSVCQRNPDKAIVNLIDKLHVLHLPRKKLNGLKIELLAADRLVKKANAVGAIYHLHGFLEKLNSHRADTINKAKTFIVKPATEAISESQHLKLISLTWQIIANIEAIPYKKHRLLLPASFDKR